MDDTGIHDIYLDFCACATAESHFVQILRYGWFPATVKRPRTAAMSWLLKLFDLLSCEAKCSAWELYSVLVRLSDNTGVMKPKVRVCSCIFHCP